MHTERQLLSVQSHQQSIEATVKWHLLPLNSFFCEALKKKTCNFLTNAQRRLWRDFISTLNMEFVVLRLYMWTRAYTVRMEPDPKSYSKTRFETRANLKSGRPSRSGRKWEMIGCCRAVVRHLDEFPACAKFGRMQLWSRTDESEIWVRFAHFWVLQSG